MIIIVIIIMVVHLDTSHFQRPLKPAVPVQALHPAEHKLEIVLSRGFRPW